MERYKLTYKFKELKTKNSAREIPLPDKVLKMLETLPKNYDLIFSDNGKPIEPKDLKEELLLFAKS